MDNASDYGSEDSRFESWQVREPFSKYFESYPPTKNTRRGMYPLKRPPSLYPCLAPPPQRRQERPVSGGLVPWSGPSSEAGAMEGPCEVVGPSLPPGLSGRQGSFMPP